MIRWIGAIFVVFSTSYAGIEHSKKLQKRIYQLTGLKMIFTDLYSDVEYGACTLTESFERIAKKQDDLYQKLLEDVFIKMKEAKGKPFELIFSNAIEDKLTSSALRTEDKIQLMRLGRELGHTQRNGQLRILQIYLQELGQQIDTLETEKQEKQKLSRILGMASGVLIVILLL